MSKKTTSNALETIHLRNDFYKDSYRRVMQALVLCIIVIIVLCGLVAYVVINPPRPKYFAVDANGRITPLIALNQPNMSPDTLLQWSVRAATAAYTYNYVTYRQDLQAASDFFTPSGWRTFVKNLQSSNNLDAVINKHLVVSAVATGAPVILWQGHLPDGRYGWRVQMPMEVTYQSASQIVPQSITVTMLIVRVDTLYSTRGVGIVQFVASAGSS